MFPARVRGETGRRQAGFNVIELVVVILIVAALAVIALPAMNKLINAQRAKSSAFDLLADLTYARSEAIARGTDVIMSSTSGDVLWNAGWTIRETAGGTVLRVGEARPSGIEFKGTATALTFERTGRVTTAGGGTVAFGITPKDSDVQEYQKRCVRLDPSGRARSVTGACT